MVGKTRRKVTYEAHAEVPCSHDWRKLGHDGGWVYYFCPLCGGRGAICEVVDRVNPPLQVDWVVGKKDTVSLMKREEDPEGLSPWELVEVKA